MEEKITSGYLLLLFSVFPLLLHEQYTDILKVKTIYFFIITIGYLLLILVCRLIRELREKKSVLRVMQLSGDEMVFAVFGAVCLFSWGLAEPKKELLYGTYGRNMGLMVLECCVFLYICLSRYFVYRQFVAVGALIAGTAVMGIGICNAMGWDVLFVNGGREQFTVFISTMGNRNTFSVYVGFLLIWGMGMFVVCRERKTKQIYGAFCFLGFAAGTAANSDGIYLMLAMTFFILLFWAKDRNMGQRFLILLTEYSAAELVMEAGRRLRGKEYCINLQGISSLMSDMAWNAGIFTAAVLMYLFLEISLKKHGGMIAEKYWRRVRGILTTGVLVAAAAGVCLAAGINIFMEAKEAERLLGEWYPYLYFSENWGTKRMQIWKAAAEIFKRMSIREKIFGYGPSGFYFAAENFLTQEELHKFTDRGILVDAHSVYLQYLITVGVIGVGMYVGLFCYWIKKFREEAEREKIMLVFLLIAAGYLIQAFVNNAHIYVEPFVIVAMGVGRKLCKKGQS